MRNRTEGLGTVVLVSLCLLAGCAGTQLRGRVCDSGGEPVRNAEIEVRAEPGGKSTALKKDGSFVLKGLEPYTAYDIIAVCLADKTQTQASNVYVQKGKNRLPENLKLRLECGTERSEPVENPSKTEPGGTEPPKPEKP